MKVCKETDVKTAAQVAAHVLQGQIATPDETAAIILAVFHSELPDIFPAPPPPPAQPGP